MEISAIKPSNYPAPELANVTPQEAAQRRELIKAIKAVNSSETLGEQNELVFVLNPGDHRPIVRLVDRKTREVVMQLPPEYVVRLAEESTRKP